MSTRKYDVHFVVWSHTALFPTSPKRLNVTASKVLIMQNILFVITWIALVTTHSGWDLLWAGNAESRLGIIRLFRCDSSEGNKKAIVIIFTLWIVHWNENGFNETPLLTFVLDHPESFLWLSLKFIFRDFLPVSSFWRLLISPGMMPYGRDTVSETAV